MVEHPGGARFLFEAHQPLAIARDEPRQHLDGHIAAEARVLGAIDGAHSTLADHLNNAIWTEDRIFLKRHRGHCKASTIQGEDCGLRIANCELEDLRIAIWNSQSAIRNPQSAIRNSQFAIRLLLFAAF